MKKTFRGIILGFIISTMLMNTVLGVQVKKTIEVVYNSVNLTVNGSKVNADNILFNGTTYVPIRAVAEALGKDVGWDQTTSTASINDIKANNPVESKPVVNPKSVTIDQVPYRIEILNPDSIGTVYAEVTYRNNTNYPITSFRMTALLKDSNTKTYYSNFDTVMPGETSPIFDSFGPLTGKLSDLQILEIKVGAVQSNGKTLHMEYDTKLMKYNYNEY